MFFFSFFWCSNAHAIVNRTRFISGPANAIIALVDGVTCAIPAPMLTYAGTKNMKLKFISLIIMPINSHMYAAWNSAFSPNPIATNLCASSWKISAGAVTRHAKRNAFLSRPSELCLNMLENM